MLARGDVCQCNETSHSVFFRHLYDSLCVQSQCLYANSLTTTVCAVGVLREWTCTHFCESFFDYDVLIISLAVVIFLAFHDCACLPNVTFLSDCFFYFVLFQKHNTACIELWDEMREGLCSTSSLLQIGCKVCLRKSRGILQH